LNALDRLKINECYSNFKVINDLIKTSRKKRDTQRYDNIKALLKLEAFNLLRTVVVDVPDRPKLRQWHFYFDGGSLIKYWCIFEQCAIDSAFNTSINSEDFSWDCALKQ